MSVEFENQALWILNESGGFAVDPDSDGSDYLAVRTDGEITRTNGQVIRPTRYGTGRGRRTPGIVTQKGGSMSFNTVVHGFATQVTDGNSPPADDWLDLLLDALFGAPVSVNGDLVTGGVTASTLEITDQLGAANLPLLVGVWDTDLNSGQTQFRRIETESGTYTYQIHRNWDTTPDTSSLMQGCKVWKAGDTFNAADTIAAYHAIDTEAWTLLGGRPSACSFSFAAGEEVRCAWGLQGDSMTAGTKGSIPAITSASIDTGTPLVGLECEIEFNGTVYAASSVTVDLRPQISEIPSVQATNGRSQIHVRLDPLVTFVPEWADAFETAFNAGTNGQVLVRMGDGDGGNALCFFMEEGEVIADPAPQNGNGETRQNVQIEYRDGGVVDTIANPRCMICRV